jgi:drug/metabolite transporter (DMT)-like permease
VRSIAGSCALVCTFYAMTRMPLPEVLTLTNTFPLWIAVISWLGFGERPTAALWLALLAAIFGVYLIQKPAFARGDATALLALAASFFSAVAMMGLHRLRDLDPRAIVVHFSSVGVLFCIGTLLLLPHDRAGAAPNLGATLLLFLGVGVSATVGQLLLTRAFATGVPSKVSVIGLTQIVFALSLDARPWRGELDAETLLGIALILVPTAWLMLSRAGRGEHAGETTRPDPEPAPEPIRSSSL